MTGTYSLEELESAYREFSLKLFNEIKSLKKEKEENDIKISNNRTNIKVLSGNKRDPLFILNNEEFLNSIDSSKEMSDFLSALRLFSDKGFLDNSCVPEICNNIYNSSVFKNEIVRLNEEIKDIQRKNSSLILLIDSLEDLKSLKEISLDLVSEYAEKFNFDKSMFRKVMLSFFYKGIRRSKNVELTDEVVETKEVSEPEEEVPEEDVTLENPEELIDDPLGEAMKIAQNNDLNPFMDEEYLLNQEIMRETEEYKKRVNEIGIRFSDIEKEYNELLNKYYMAIASLSPVEQNTYLSYVQVDDQVIDFGEYDEAYSYVSAYKVFDTKKRIEAQKSKIIDNNYSTVSQIDELEILVEEFNSECKKLQLIDNKLEKGKAVPKIANSTPYVYFLLDSQGNLAIDESDNELMSAYEKMAKYDKADTVIKKAGIKNKNETIKRVVFSQRVGKTKLINYIILNIGDEAGIMILNGCPYSESYKESQKNAERLIDQNSMMINAEISLIESQNPEFIELQNKVRESLINKTLGM